MLMLAGQLALIVASIFTGAAFYINFAEQPARLDLEPRAFLIQWKRAYARGYTMQASLVAIGTLLGLLALWQTAGIAWLAGALIFIANLPFTLIVIMPVNNALKAIDPANAAPESRALLQRWAALHAVRTALGLAATLVFLWASVN
jgi:hypothetical protein